MAVPAFPLTDPLIALVTVKLTSVPTEVRLLAVTVALRVVPVSVVAAAVTVISADPLNATPLMLRDVVSVAALVAVEALPESAP